MEEALRENQERLARTEDFSLVMATHVGLDGRWLRVPPTLCELLGYTEEELLAGYFKHVTHPDDFEADWNQCQRLIRGEIQSFDLEKRHLHKDGHIIWVYLNCSIVTDAKGKPVHFLTYIRDITRRKRAEEQLNLLQTITLDVAAAGDLASALEVVLRRVCERTGWVSGKSGSRVKMELFSTAARRGSAAPPAWKHLEGRLQGGHLSAGRRAAGPSLVVAAPGLGRGCHAGRELPAGGSCRGSRAESSAGDSDPVRKGCDRGH